MTYRLVLLVGALFIKLMGLRVTVRGVEHVPATGPVVLAVSHFSYLDFALAEQAVWRSTRRQTRFLAIQEAFSHRFAGRPMRAMGHIPVGRGAAAYRLARTALRHGELVGVFPESRVSGSFTLLPFKAGAARLAEETGAPLIPCVVWGSHRVLTRTHPRDLRRSRHCPVLLAFGPPVTDGAQLYVLMEQMMTELQEVYPVDGRGQWWQPAHLGGSAPSPEQADLLDGRTFEQP
ncbi:MAG: glycerol acyltransferase [Frankiales bacterium]|nr:glycerol acyltransferase [Frankiales bacterium]